MSLRTMADDLLRPGHGLEALLDNAAPFNRILGLMEGYSERVTFSIHLIPARGGGGGGRQYRVSLSANTAGDTGLTSSHKHRRFATSNCRGGTQGVIKWPVG